jgi:hypothetical protein
MVQNYVEQTKRNERFYFYLYPFKDLIQGNFQIGFYVCIKLRTFLRTFLTKSQL